MVSDNDSRVWYVKLPAEWKAIFDKLAKQKGDTTHGAAARHLRQVITPMVHDAEASA